MAVCDIDDYFSMPSIACVHICIIRMLRHFEASIKSLKFAVASVTRV